MHSKKSGKRIVGVRVYWFGLDKIQRRHPHQKGKCITRQQAYKFIFCTLSEHAQETVRIVNVVISKKKVMRWKGQVLPSTDSTVFVGIPGSEDTTSLKVGDQLILRLAKEGE